MKKLFIIYLIFMSLSEIVLYKVDKERSKKGAWRVKESALLGISILGGSAGAVLAMHLFHHKTRHWYFKVINYSSLILHLFIIWRLFFK